MFRGMTTISYLKVKDLFFTSLVATIEGIQGNPTPADKEEKHLESVLTAWKCRRVPVTGDGNCLFMAIAMGIIDRIRSGDLSLIHQLQLDENATIPTIIMALRRQMVHEWNTNDFYQAFVTLDISTISEEFLASGCFKGDLGDLIVLTLANVLHCPIILFTSISDMPIICIAPTVEAMNTTHPIFLTFFQSGAGHYDYAVPYKEDVMQARPTASTTKCTCGDFKGKACCTSRCTCIRSKKPCTSLCRCKGCGNILGARPPPSIVRRRIAYDSQRQPLCGQTGDSFMAKKKVIAPFMAHYLFLRYLS